MAAFEIACAKLRANQAAGEAASIAHQVHGAIGFTREYDLQRFTRRLWSWRSEYGNERHWADAIGARAARAGTDGFWPALVSGFAELNIKTCRAKRSLCVIPGLVPGIHEHRPCKTWRGSCSWMAATRAAMTTMERRNPDRSNAAKPCITAARWRTRSGPPSNWRSSRCA